MARASGGVSQPLQLLAQRGLGARQQVGGRENTSARLPPPRAGVTRQHEVQQLVAESQKASTSWLQRQMEKAEEACRAELDQFARTDRVAGDR